MTIIAFPLILAVLTFWLYAEIKMGFKARIASSVLVIVCSGYLVYAFCQVKPLYENAWQRNSIRDAATLLKQGHTNVVISAFETYSSIAATDSTFRASEQMMHALQRGQTN